MTNQPSEKLKNCPFCGGDAYITTFTKNYPSQYVTCRLCAAMSTVCANNDAATNSWNTRRTPEAVTIAREDLGRIKTLIGHIRFKQSRDAHGKLCMAECDEILEILENTEK